MCARSVYQRLQEPGCQWEFLLSMFLEAGSLQLLMRSELQPGPNKKGKPSAYRSQIPLVAKFWILCGTKLTQKITGCSRKRKWKSGVFFLCLMVSESLRETTAMFSRFFFVAVEVNSVFENVICPNNYQIPTIPVTFPGFCPQLLVPTRASACSWGTLPI